MKTSIFSRAFGTAFLSLIVALNFSSIAFAASPSCAVVVGPDEIPGLETQQSRATFRLDDVFFRDYLTENDKIDPRTQLPAKKLSFWERQEAISSLLGMFAIHPARSSPSKVAEADTIYLAIEIGDALDGAGFGWTATQRLGLKYTYDAQRKVFKLQRISLINENVDNDNEGMTLIDNPLNSDLSDFKTGTREVLWNNYVKRTQLTPSLEQSAVAAQRSDLDARKLRFDQEFKVPTVIGKKIGDGLTARAKWILEIENRFLQQRAFQAKNWLMQKAFYFTYQGYTMVLTGPLKMLASSSKVLVPTVLPLALMLFHNPSRQTAEDVLLRLYHSFGSANAASAGSIVPMISNDDLDHVLSGYVNPKYLNELNLTTPTGNKKSDAPSPQSVLTKYLSSIGELEAENMADVKASSSDAKPESNPAAANLYGARENKVGELDTLDFAVLSKNRAGDPVTLHIMEFLASKKILIATTSGNSAAPTSFAVITESKNPEVYRNLIAKHSVNMDNVSASEGRP